ncbi:Alpha/Beta hydrolase protein [Collybia nuda]|uniref:Alpha/Beta hydrolase protein n=1 Tax=Collybia nuda TaxID=64659 RepID=A0A9P5YE56_9AGAR|nr:Alpha/Beta hydrolase protein [Collybia nuda]
MSNEKLLASSNGRTLSYEDAGLTTSPLVVLFFRGTLTVGQAKLSPVLASLGAHYISPTLPGYGNTSSPMNGVSYATTIQSDMTALLGHLHPNMTGMQLYIGGGSFGTIAAQILYGAPFDAFPAGRHLKGLLLLGAFPPFRDDEEKGFVYSSSMTWGNYITLGPKGLRPLYVNLSLIRWETEKEKYAAWRERKGYEVGQLEREMAQMNRRSVEKTWEGFLSTSEVLHGNWGWGGKSFEDLDEEHTAGRHVFIIAATEDDLSPGAWGEYLVTKYNNARIKWVEGSHIAVTFSMDDIWADFMKYCAYV